MSTESLVLHFSDETLLVRPRASLDSVAAPFLAEEAYPRILAALLDTHLGDGDENRICLSEENIAAVASAASGALFGDDDVFARFLVVPRVESAISVLLWRVRINSTCAGTITEGQTGIQLPSVPVRVLASSLAGLLDNTKLYASSKQVAFPAPHTPLQKHESRLVDHHHHHLAPPTPLTATARTHSDPGLAPARPPPPRLSFSRPMTPPDSAVVETTPISASDASTADTFLTPTTPTSKRSGVPRVKFRPPPIITRTTPSRPIPRLTQSAGAVTLTFAAAGLSGCEIEPLPYLPKTKEHDQEKPTTDNIAEPAEKQVEKTPEKDDESPPSPPPTAKPKPSRPPSPNPPRAPSPTKRVLRKAPPTPKSRPRSIVRSPSPTKQSMWAPAGVEAHYRSPSPTKLAPPVRTKSMIGASGSRAGSMESSPALSRNLDLPGSSTGSPAMVAKSKLRAPSPAPRTPSPSPAPAPLDDSFSPSPSQSMPGSDLRSPSSNLLRSPGSLLNGSSTGFGSPSGSMVDMRDKPLVTPTTPRRTVSVSGVKFEVIESPLPSRHASWSVHQPSTPSRTPPAQDTLSPSPNALRSRLGASPGATSLLSTIPSLSPFPDSDSDNEFGMKKDKESEEEDLTVTSKIRGLGLMRAVTPPTRASTSTPTRKSPPPINTNTSSPSRNSKRSYTVGVPMTQMSSHPPTNANASESEAESLAFPGSTSTLSLPGDISLPELVSPFTTPLELGPSSSSGGEGDSSPTQTRFGDGPMLAGAAVAGFGPKREPLPIPRSAGPVSGSGSVLDPRLSTSFVSEPLSSDILASVLQSRSRPGSIHHEHRTQSSESVPRSQSRSGSVPPGHAHSGSQARSGSVPPAHSRSGSTQSVPRPAHSRSGSQVRLGGRESEMDLLVPFAGAEGFSRADVLRLMTKSGSTSNVGTNEPVRTSVIGGPPLPVFMNPGSAPPSQVGKRISLARSPPSSSSESNAQVEALSHSRIPSEASYETDESMACTTEVEVGAGRARIQSGVGIGGGRSRGGKRVKKGESPTKPKFENLPRAKLDSPPRARVDSSSRAKVDSGLARSSSAATARPRVDSVRARAESFTRPRVDSAVRARLDSVTRPRVDSSVRARVDSGLRRKSGANESPVSPASPGSVSRSPSSASARRPVGRKPSAEGLGRRTPIGRKASATSMRKSSTSSLRSTTTTTTRTTPVTVSTKKTSVSSVSGTSTPRSGASTPRSRTMSTGAKENTNGIATPKQSGTPRPSLSTPRTSMSSGRNVGSPRPSLTIPRTSAASPRSSPRTPVATTPTNKTPVARVPPTRPQRSSLRPGPRTNTLSTSAPAVTQSTPGGTPTLSEYELAPLTAPAVPAPTLVSRATSPPRNRATSLDTSPSKAQLGTEDARPRRVTSVSTKPPPLSRSSVVTSTLAPPPAPPPLRARASSRTTSSGGHEDGGVPFPIPESASESEGGLKVPSTPKSLKRSLSVSSAARRLVGRARGTSPVPDMPTPAMDAASLAPSTTASTTEKAPDQVQEKAPKSGRSLSRLAFSALLPKRSANNAAAEAKAALAQAKAREVAEAKAKAKIAAEEAKARAKAEAEAKAAAKEPRRLVRRFGSMSKKSSVAS